MKIKLTLLAILVSTSGFLFAQANKASWAEMKNFHHFISTTFHPSEEGNLKPLKEKTDSMYIAAKQWRASAIPPSYKKDETKTALKKLVKQCEETKKMIAKKASDEQLTKQIAAVHDTFHTIVKECRKEDEEKH